MLVLVEFDNVVLGTDIYVAVGQVLRFDKLLEPAEGDQGIMDLFEHGVAVDGGEVRETSGNEKLMLDFDYPADFPDHCVNGVLAF